MANWLFCILDASLSNKKGLNLNQLASLMQTIKVSLSVVTTKKGDNLKRRFPMAHLHIVTD